VELSQLHLGEETIDVRVEVLPTKEGEKLTLYVLRPDSAPSSLADLGMAPDSEQRLRSAIDSPLGAILFCGPAESGTTTTLRAALRALNTPDRQLATIENTVEQVIPGIDQVEIDPAAGLTFARGFHAILRSDPDVIGVGEIHGEEAASVTFETALTDSLVLATVRARTAAAAIRRLTDMGVDATLLGSALVCVLAQRLVRRICSDCREGYYATPDELRELGRPAEEASPRLLARGRGCPTCGGTGYHGRAGIFEILPLTDEIRGLVGADASTAEIQTVAVAAGMRTLREDGIRLCLEGVTTAAEVQRVLGDQYA
jgi:type IV pilus assembly protein PilB